MTHQHHTRPCKTALATALTLALGGSLLATPSAAAVYTFSFGSCTTSNCSVDASDPRANDALVTLLDSQGVATGNVSIPYYYDATWGYGARTQISGTLTFDTADNSGTATLLPFDFLGSGPAVQQSLSFSDAGLDPANSHQLVLADFVWDWAGNEGIFSRLIWDVSGLLAAIDAGLAVGDSVSGTGALPASNDIRAGQFPIGPAPIATTAYDSVSPFSSDGIGGVPMSEGPFPGFSVNLDIASLTLTSAVPLPAGVWLFASGLLGLVGAARRRQRSQQT